MQCQVYNKQNNYTVYSIYFITILVIAEIVNKCSPCNKFILFSRRTDLLPFSAIIIMADTCLYLGFYSQCKPDNQAAVDLKGLSQNKFT